MFRGKTFVIAFGGKAIMGPLAWTLAYDVNLLAALGIRLVAGARRPAADRGGAAREGLGIRTTAATGSPTRRRSTALSTPSAASISNSRRCSRRACPTRRWPTARSASSAATSSPARRSASSTASTCSTPAPCARWTPKASAPSSARQHRAALLHGHQPDRRELQPGDGRGGRGDRDGAQCRQAGLPLRQPRRHRHRRRAARRTDGRRRRAPAGIGDWLSTDLKRYLPCAVRASRAASARACHRLRRGRHPAAQLFSRDGIGTVVTRESLENCAMRGRTTSAA